MNLVNKIREHSILFTEACPLMCRYCHLRSKEEIQVVPDYDTAFMVEKIKNYIKKDKEDGFITQILFTGGEPFLFWNSIKDIMIQFPDLRYHFNTSGYLLTKEIIEFLSAYSVSFTLSCDGNEVLTNYLRPNKANKYGVGYMKYFRTISPILLYYFPEVSFKMIVAPRYVDKVYETYLFAEEIGFKNFSLMIDFNCREYEKSLLYDLPWTEKESQILLEQIQLICMEILEGWRNNIIRPMLPQMNEILSFFLKNKTFSPEELPCGLFNNRTLSTIYDPEEKNCLSNYFPSLEEAKKIFIEEWNTSQGSCVRDNNCPNFAYCASKNCIANSYKETGSFIKIEELECILNKILFQAGVPMIETANQICQDRLYYQLFLKDLLDERR